MSIDKIQDLTVDIIKDNNIVDTATKRTFYSQDKETAIIRFQVRENGEEFDFSAIQGISTTVAIRTADRSLFTLSSNIVDPAKGIVEVVIPQDVLLHAGQAEGELYIDSGTKRNATVQFSFRIKLSLIDKEVLTTPQEIASIENIARAVIEDIQVNGVDLSNYYTKSEADAKYALKSETSTGSVDMTGYDKTTVLDTKYAPITHTHTATDVGTYTKSEIDDKIATAQSGGTIDLSSYLKSSDASTTYASKVHTHTIGDISNLQVTLDGKALSTHNHDSTYIKIATGQNYKLYADDGTVPITSTVDLNNIDAKITKSGMYYITTASNVPSGAPTVAIWLDYEVRQDKTYRKMTIMSYSTNEAWTRTMNNNVWTAWTKIAMDESKFALATHTHAISDIANLQNTLDSKLTKTMADTLYAPIGSTGGSGGTTVVDDKNKVNVNTKFGFVGDGITDNYQAFKDMIAFNKLNPEVKLEFDGQYNGQRAKYRVDRYVTIASIEGSYASGSPTHMVWEGRMVHLITNGALFINMPMNGFTKTKAFTRGGWHYAKEEPITLFNFEKVQSVLGDNLYIDGENYKLKFEDGFTSKEGENAKWSADNLPLAEGRGHGIILSGSTNIAFKNISAINQVVDGIAMGFYADYTKMEVTQSSNVSITNVTTNGNGRLGISGLGACNGHITNFISEYNGMNKNADGMYISSSPAGGFDFEPHHSPISTDNNTPPSYTVEDWNGNFVIENARIRYNSGTQIACTSTLLTRTVVLQRATVRPPKGRTGDHLLIQASLQNCKFIDCDIDGKLADGKLSRVVFYGAGYVSESTGVITGQPANVWSEVIGGRWANIEPWVNTDGNTTYNEIPTGQYGLHNISFTGLVMDNVLFTLRTIRRFNFLNVVMNYPSDSVVNKLIIWNANMKDVVMINRKSSNITLDLGSGDTQSNFENLRLTSNKFDFSSGTKKYKTAVISNEAMDVYDYTRAMEYILGNGTTPTPPADTTPPNAPTVNTVYTDSTTITGTAEANSTITVLFNGGYATTATTNGSGNWTVTKPGAVTLTVGMSINVTAKDASNNVSSATTVTVQAVQTGTGGNLWPTTSFDFTGKTIPQAGGSGSKLVVNPVFTVSNNEAQALDMSGSGDTITFASKAGTSKYGIFTLEPNKQYTIRVKATDTIANASDLVTMISKTDTNYIWPNPRVVDLTFTTGSDGKFGYDFNGVTYGGATSSFVFHRANGVKDSTTTYKIWLNPGATSTATWSS
ncbi:BppU family phage baseplate upper protein [Macrococcoides bohemicum]|uniref:BppU family phage baseplate upper protein n=1 Tax=Macrococcoides bohemicum TaxID=1903056 RepID=A0AAJ4TW40_9STAP|nr:BppU family phage baseplate upper protein [Macrococcus bohemicus]QYA42056.1 BppU family phage baseplate upper protein [Macrococcus bohemicus]